VREYRIQSRWADGWHFITDGHGKYRTYSSYDMAMKHGAQHAVRRWNKDTLSWEYLMEDFRVVYADIDWQVATA
jgi:hypothetical protein